MHNRNRTGKRNLLISPECLAWAEKNGYNGLATSLPAMVEAYRQWQLANGKRLSLQARPAAKLEAQTAALRKRLADYEAALAGRNENAGE
jgi:hypothetical protein